MAEAAKVGCRGGGVGGSSVGGGAVVGVRSKGRCRRGDVSRGVGRVASVTGPGEGRVGGCRTGVSSDVGVNRLGGRRSWDPKDQHWCGRGLQLVNIYVRLDRTN